MSELEVSISALTAKHRSLSTDIVQLRNSLREKERELASVERAMNVVCEHRWVVDYVDQLQPYREGVRVEYCEYCELTRH